MCSSFFPGSTRTSTVPVTGCGIVKAERGLGGCGVSHSALGILQAKGRTSVLEYIGCSAAAVPLPTFFVGLSPWKLIAILSDDFAPLNENIDYDRGSAGVMRPNTTTSS